MPPRPRLSLCVPTFNRASYLEGALKSGLIEAKNLSPGTVEVLVCDNGSTDGTAELIARIQAEHPELRVFRNEQNLGFDLNYLRCVEEARGEFVWVMGDDDVWLPGSLSRVLREFDAGADACLCLSEACDQDLNPFIVLPWYLDPEPQTAWNLEGREDLIHYFNACARNAGVFAFISVGIFRRDRFLSNRESLIRGATWGYIHLWGMVEFLRQPLHLHYIPEALIRNRIGEPSDNVNTSAVSLFRRWMHDLRAWAAVADALFGDDPETHDAFSRIIGRNHHNTILPGLRKHALDEASWLEAVPYLIRAGFSPVRIAAVDFAFQHMYGSRLPMPTLDPRSLCLADLPLVARGAEHIAVLALGGLRDIVDGAGLLAALRSQRGPSRVRIFCTPECGELLEGFDVQCLDPRRYAREEAHREVIAASLAEFSPELVVNLDLERGIQADDLVNAALPAGAIAYELPQGEQDAKLIKAKNGAYTCLVPRGAGPEAMLEALGLKENPPALWPSLTSQEEAKTVMGNLAWDPARTLAVMVDHPSISEDPAFQSAFEGATQGGWTIVGIGGRGTYQVLENLLGPLEGRAVNFAGVLNLGALAALLQLCGGFLGGTPLLQTMAKACGCNPIQTDLASEPPRTACNP